MFGGRDDRPIFVVGSPRSGTTFTAKTIGSVNGYADLGELAPLKRSIPHLITHPPAEAAQRIRSIIARAQRLGQMADLHVIEQTPESTFLINSIATAFPHARFLHLVRDGRDVASSLIGLGWLSHHNAAEVDDVGHNFGDDARFWVEPERRREFVKASEATRAAWVWRRYEIEARTQLAQHSGRALEVRYEALVSDTAAEARRIAAFLDVDGAQDEFIAAFATTVSTSSGRWKRDLTPSQLTDIMVEAGALLGELGYS